MRERRRREAARRPPWRFDRLLNVHAEVDRVQQRLHCPLDLVVRARAAHHHERLAVLHHERALQRAARPLSRLERIGFACNEGVVIATAIEDEPEIAHHDARAPAAVKARLEADHVAVLVDDGDVAGVAAVAGIAFEVDRYGPITGLRVRHVPFGIARTQLQRGMCRIDQLAAFLRVVLGEESCKRNPDEVHVS